VLYYVRDTLACFSQHLLIQSDISEKGKRERTNNAEMLVFVTGFCRPIALIINASLTGIDFCRLDNTGEKYLEDDLRNDATEFCRPSAPSMEVSLAGIDYCRPDNSAEKFLEDDLRYAASELPDLSDFDTEIESDAESGFPTF
jgi:hypothetical protein